MIDICQVTSRDGRSHPAASSEMGQGPSSADRVRWTTEFGDRVRGPSSSSVTEPEPGLQGPSSGTGDRVRGRPSSGTEPEPGLAPIQGDAAVVFGCGPGLRSVNRRPNLCSSPATNSRLPNGIPAYVASRTRFSSSAAGERVRASPHAGFSEIQSSGSVPELPRPQAQLPIWKGRIGG